MNSSPEELEKKLEKIQTLEIELKNQLQKKNQQLKELRARIIALQERVYRIIDARALFNSILRNQGHGSVSMIQEVNSLTKRKLKLDSESESESETDSE